MSLEQVNPEVLQLVNDYGFENYTSEVIQIKAKDEEKNYDVSTSKVAKTFAAIQKHNRIKLQRDIAMYDSMKNNLPKKPPCKIVH